VALAGFEQHSSLSICNNAAWAIGEMFVTCVNSDLLKVAM
jgi:hypothetical protein